MLYNLLDLDGNVKKTWNLDEKYKEKLNLVFNNEYEEIRTGSLIVYIGELPEFFIIEAGEVTELTREQAVGKGIIQEVSEVEQWEL